MSDFRQQVSAFLDTQQAPAEAAPQSQFRTSVAGFLDEQDQKQRQLRQSVTAVGQTTPEQAAKHRYLSQVTGMPETVVKTAEGEASALARFQEISRAAAADPVLRAKLQNPGFLAVAQDDTSILTEIAQAAKMVGLGATVGVGQFIQNTVAAGADMVGSIPLPGMEAFGRMGQNLRGQARRTQEAVDYFSPDWNSLTGRAVSSGLYSLGANLAMLPLGIQRAATAGPLAGATGVAAPLGVATGAEAYNEMRDIGGSRTQALAYGVPQGAFEYLFELMPASKLFSDLSAGKGVLKTMAGQLGPEVITEQFTTIAQDFNKWMNMNPDKTVREFLAERPEAAYQTFIATLIGVAGQTGAIKGISKLAGVEEEMRARSDQAERFMKSLADMQKTMEASKLLERAPDELRTFAQELMADQGVSNFYIDTSKLQEAGVNLEELAQVLPSLQPQLEAARSGMDIVIPAGELLTDTIGTNFSAPLMDHLRPTEDGMSRAEAKEWMASKGDEVKADVARVLSEKEQDAEFQNSRAVVEKQILDGLNATGRFSPKQNQQIATLASTMYAVQAAKVGKTPEQLAGEYRLGFTDKPLGDQQTYDQEGKLVTNTPQFKNFFGDSKVVDDQGKPLVVYHGTASDFDSFDPDAEPYTYAIDKGKQFFSSSRMQASNYAVFTAQEFGGSPNVMPVYLRMVSPRVEEVDGSPDSWWDSRPDYFWEIDVAKRGHDGLIVKGDNGQTMYVTTRPEQIKSAIGNNGNFDPADPNILNQSATLRSGKEKLDKFLKAVGLKPGGKYKTREVAAALEARQREKYGKIDPEDRSPEAVEKIAKWMVAEVEFEMQNPERSGVGWYSEKFQRALDTMGNVFPELKTDKNSRNMMTALIAITSDGQKVVPNFAQAMDIYGNFRSTGKFTTTRGHQRQASIDINLQVIQRLHDTMGVEAMHEYLMQEKTISELKKIAKANGGEMKSDYQAHIKMPMAAVEFGPKFGAFYANLMGAHGYLTMDRWWSRTFNRYRGTLLTAPTQQGLDRFKQLLGNPEMSNDEAIAATVEPRKSYEAKGFKNGTEIEKAANTIGKAAFDALEDAPFNATDRTFMLDAVNKAQKSLKRKGANLTVADIQAILWYYEKRLYGELGARQTADISYEEAAQRVASSYASGSGVESLLDDSQSASEDGGANEGGVPVGEEDFGAGQDGAQRSGAVFNQSAQPEVDYADDRVGISRVLLELGSLPGMFQYAKSDATDLKQIAADKGATEVKLLEDSENDIAAFLDSIEVIEDPVDGEQSAEVNQAAVFREIIKAEMAKNPGQVSRVWTVNLGGKDAGIFQIGEQVYINVAPLTEGGKGSLVYDIAANYAVNNGLKFVGDPAGLSDAALRRRTENMLSSAIKYGSTDFIVPHPRQLQGEERLGVPALKWTEGDTLGNIRAMVDVTTASNAESSPYGTAITYDPESGAFRDSEGATLDLPALESVSEADGRTAGAGQAGRTTLQRDALYRALLSGPDARRAVVERIGRLRRDGSQGTGDALSRSFYQGVGRLGFYSALARATGAINIKSSTAQGWKDAIKGLINKGQVKADEVEWSGLNDWLDLQEGKVTKEQVQQYLEANGVRVEEVTLTNDYSKAAAFDSLDGGGNPTKYGKYTLPGGENYREVLLTLPVKESQIKDVVLDWEETSEYMSVAELPSGNYIALSHELDGSGSLQLLTKDAVDIGLTKRYASVEQARKAAKEFAVSREQNVAKAYRSNHWDQPNVLAHIRVNDRTDADGKRVLFVEEIQSDWGQEGKKNGFRKNLTAAQQQRVDALNRVTEERDFTDAEQAEYDSLRDGFSNDAGIPAAPFVTKTDGWLNLALKRVITMAAEGGYDRVAFVNGEQSADRYDLSKQISMASAIANGDGTYNLIVEDKRGDEVGEFSRSGKKMTPQELEDTVGKDLAKKLIDGAEAAKDKPWPKNSKVNPAFFTLRGLDLKVGGEGMKTFYDQIVPSAVKKLLPKVGGGQMGEVKIGKTEGQSVDKKQVKEVAIQYMNGELAPEEAIEEIGLPITEAELDDAIGGRYEPGARQRTVAKNFADMLAEKFAPGKRMTQPGFDITPAMREIVAGGLPLFQDNRGQIGFPSRGMRSGETLIAVLERADLSTIPHELGHFFWEMQFDLASQIEAKLQAGGELTEGEQSLLNDVNEGLKWSGLDAAEGQTLLQTWMALDNKGAEPYHERFARGLEAYLMEGKSPSLAMRNLFQTFRAWLVGVYRKLVGGSSDPSNRAIGEALDVKLTPEFRMVMDRMVATTEEIAEAEAARSMGPLFKSAEEGGMDMEAYQLYQQLGLQHTQDAIDYLQAASMRDLQWLNNAKSKMLKEMQAKHDELRAGIRAEVESEVMNMPAVKAQQQLAQLEAEFEDSPLSADMNTQAVAEANGFATIEQMNNAIRDFGDVQTAIETAVDIRMMEEHASLASPEGLQRAVNEAIHNEARARFVATELRALQHAMSVRRSQTGTRATVDVLKEAAKEIASGIIGKKKIGEIRPLQYVQAAARNGKAAQRATGDIEKQIEYKRNQLVNTVAAKMAYDARDEIAKMDAFFKKVANSKDSKGRDMDLVNAARAVVAAFGYGSESKGLKALEYLEKVKAYDAALYEVLRQSTDSAMSIAKPVNELTLEEMRQVYNEVEGLWHKSIRLRQMEIDGNKMDRAELADELAAVMDTMNAPPEVGKYSAPTPEDLRRDALSTAKAALRRVESWVDSMDGGKMGPFRRFIFTPIKEAADKYRAQKKVYVKKYRDSLMSIAGSFQTETYHSKTLNYTFGKETGGVAMNEILHAILHTGNESNKRKLLLGREWAVERPDGSLDTSRWDAFMKELIDSGKLTKAHMDWVQSTWDLLESLKPGAQKAHRDAYGTYFEEIKPDSIVTPWGVYKGGYAPAMVDSRSVKDAELKKLVDGENESLQYAFPSTSKGFTKSRVEYNKPLLLDLRTIGQHIDKVLLFTHMENPVRDVRMLLASTPVSERLNRLDPGAINHMLVPWLTRSAQQRVSTPISGAGFVNRFLNGLRNRSSLALMFANVSNTAQQITGFSLAAVKVRPALLLQATADYMKSPTQMTKTVAASSVYMANRMDNEVSAMRDDIDAILLDPNLYQKSREWAKRHAYFMQSAVDNVMGPIIWTAAYNQALEQGETETDAKRLADATVRQTQGSTLAEDVSRLETGHPFWRLFMQFAGYFNMQANLLGTEFSKLSREVGLRKGMGKGLMLLTTGFMVPAILAQAIAEGFRGGPDDEDKDGEYLDDWLMSLLVFAPIKTATAMVPGVGQVTNAALNKFTSNPADDRMSLSPAVSMIEAAAAIPYHAYKAATDELNDQRAIRDLGSTITMTVGLPATVAAKPLGYLAGMAEDKIEPTGPVDMARGLVTGTASPESKVR